MCIRDRVLVAELAIAHVEFQSFIPQLSAEEHPARKVVEVPVSYTHLRAHETVLDLVCRLLLEKKNDTQLNIIICATPTTQTTHIDSNFNAHSISNEKYKIH